MLDIFKEELEMKTLSLKKYIIVHIQAVLNYNKHIG